MLDRVAKGQQCKGSKMESVRRIGENRRVEEKGEREEKWREKLIVVCLPC